MYSYSQYLISHMRHDVLPPRMIFVSLCVKLVLVLCSLTLEVPRHLRICRIIIVGCDITLVADRLPTATKHRECTYG